MKHLNIYILSLLICLPSILFAQKVDKDWFMEAEDVNSSVKISDGIIDIIAPKGMTLWNIHPMTDNTVIDYEAQIKVEDGNTKEWNRLSDLNCFWLATDPSVKDGSVLKNASKRHGVFVNQYALQLYYMGYGGNRNTTTRFRRYTGDVLGVTDATYRPAILREYTDADNLLKPNHWYKIHIEQKDGHVIYTIDGKTLVDYLDINPFKYGYFGFRTTLAHAQLRNFKAITAKPDNTISLHWINGKAPSVTTPQTFGIPFAKGELKEGSELSLKSGDNVIPSQQWTLAHWPDGSVKWKAVAAVIPANSSRLMVQGAKVEKGSKSSKCSSSSRGVKGDNIASTTDNQIIINTDSACFYIPKEGCCLIDSIVNNGIRTSGKSWMELNGKVLNINKVMLEQNGPVRACVKIDGDRFTMRLYAYRGSTELKMVHTLLVDSALNKTGLSSLGLRTKVPMRDVDYKRSISFATDSKRLRPQGLQTDKQYSTDTQDFKVKPLVARRPILIDDDGNITDPRSLNIVRQLAAWDGFRLSQLSPNGYSIRKRATAIAPWIGTMEGTRAPGSFAVYDTKGGTALSLTDFWQSYPSTLQVDDARSTEATATVWLWSPEAEAMSFEHYDTIAHGLDASYEDVQKGMSTAYGIARTSTIYLKSLSGLSGSNSLSGLNSLSGSNGLSSLRGVDNQLAVSPEYLHKVKAFGIWSLPTSKDSIETSLSRIMKIYEDEIERNSWYGYFNYGDVMHSYDSSRGQWRYDVGGYAWDNTELASNGMFWYNFLRTGDPAVWRMAVAITRHTAEVDVYHQGPNAGLGSRHNVSHWGCGAKEARISQAFWNRFLYYLTADERAGDLMTEVVDADQKLYTLDPMRLAQPRSPETPCTAPARLRIGPDWLAYAGNWFTEWERTGNRKYYDKILTGMKSIAAMPHGIFSGPKALGYDPATGVISWEGDTAVQHTNHLMTIMGGFEFLNEMMLSINCPEWNTVWLDYTIHYKEKAWQILQNKFPVPRLKLYAYWKTGNRSYLNSALEDMSYTPFSPRGFFFTNDAATWSLDAIYLKEIAQ